MILIFHSSELKDKVNCHINIKTIKKSWSLKLRVPINMPFHKTNTLFWMRKLTITAINRKRIILTLLVLQKNLSNLILNRNLSIHLNRLKQAQIVIHLNQLIQARILIHLKKARIVIHLNKLKQARIVVHLKKLIQLWSYLLSKKHNNLIIQITMRVLILKNIYKMSGFALNLVILDSRDIKFGNLLCSFNDEYCICLEFYVIYV